MTNTDSTLVFMSPQQVVKDDRLSGLQALFDSYTNSEELSPLQKLQYKILSEWFKSGKVPFAEIVQWSGGLISPAEGESYVLFLGGLLVSDNWYLTGIDD